MDTFWFYFYFVLYVAWILYFWTMLFETERDFISQYYENSFIKSWSIIYIIIGILSYLGGQQDRIGAAFQSGFFSTTFYLLGSVLGIIIFSLVLTHLYVLIKIPLKKIHQITNKKDIKIEVPSETELKEFLKYHRQSYAVIKNNWEYWEDVYKAWLKST
jgi:succinate dehydrogenase hydrophobic anchor subunit